MHSQHNASKIGDNADVGYEASDNARRVPEQQRSKERVGRVLDAAAGLIESEGIDAISMSKLAEAADVSLPSIYRYFPSKRAILRTLLERYRTRMIEYVMPRLPRPQTDADLHNIVRESVRRFWDFCEQEPAYLAVWAAGFADPEFSQMIVASQFGIGAAFRSQFGGRVQARPGDDLSLFMVSYLTAAMARAAQVMPAEQRERFEDLMMTRAIPAILDLHGRVSEPTSS